MLLEVGISIAISNLRTLYWSMKFPGGRIQIFFLASLEPRADQWKLLST